MTLEDYDAYVCIYVCELRVCLVFYKMKGLLNQLNKVLLEHMCFTCLRAYVIILCNWLIL